MIASLPLEQSSAFATMAEKVAAYLAAARLAASDGITWAEFGELMLGLLRVSASALEVVDGMTGPQKKELVLEAAASLFDQIADYAIPLAMLPIWILVRPAVRSLVLAIASGAIEQLLPILRGR